MKMTLNYILVISRNEILLIFVSFFNSKLFDCHFITFINSLMLKFKSFTLPL